MDAYLYAGGHPIPRLATPSLTPPDRSRIADLSDEGSDMAGSVQGVYEWLPALDEAELLPFGPAPLMNEYNT